METYALLCAATMNAGTVLALASLGLLINEKAGIVNLGAEGMMLCAAIAGFATVATTGSDILGFLAGKEKEQKIIPATVEKPFYLALTTTKSMVGHRNITLHHQSERK